MICRYCTKEIMDGSIFCSFCGERVARKKKAKKAEIKVPKPRQLKSGAWNIELCNLRLEHRDAAVRGTVVNSLLCVDCGLICNDLVDLVNDFLLKIFVVRTPIILAVKNSPRVNP